MRDAYALCGVVGFFGGVAYASLIPVSLYGALALALSGIALCTMAPLQTTRTATLVVGIFMCAAALGALRLLIAQPSLPADAVASLGREVLIEGTVVREVQAREHSTHVFVDTKSVDGADVQIRALAYASPYADIAYGDVIHMRGVIERPESFETDTGRMFNYPGYLSARGVSVVIYSPREIMVIGEGGNSIMHFLLSAKHALLRSIERVLPPPESDLLAGLLLGEKRALGERLTDAFRATGVIHIVVLSGYNVTLVADWIMRIAAFFPLSLRLILGGVGITAFAVLTGASATVVRASIMAVLVLIARATGRAYEIVRALVAAALVMVFVSPHVLLFDPGFQLSFVATLGLIIAAPWVTAVLARARIPNFASLRDILAATLATQLFVLPLLLFISGEVSLIAPLANVLVLVAVPAAMLIGFFAGAVGIVSASLAVPLSLVAYAVLTYQLGIVELLARLPFASIAVPAIPAWSVALLYVSAALAGVYLYAKRAVHAPRVLHERVDAR